MLITIHDNPPFKHAVAAQIKHRFNIFHPIAKPKVLLPKKSDPQEQTHRQNIKKSGSKMLNPTTVIIVVLSLGK